MWGKFYYNSEEYGDKKKVLEVNLFLKEGDRRGRMTVVDVKRVDEKKANGDVLVKKVNMTKTVRGGTGGR